MDELQNNGFVDEDVLVALIKRAQKHLDPEAFDSLYLLFSDRIFRYVTARIGNPHAAEEITSEIFVRLIEKISLFRIAPKDNVPIFSAWLYRMSHNKMVDALRIDTRARQVEQEHARRVGLNDSGVKVDERLDIEEVLQKLRYLNDQQHEVIVLRFIEGLSIVETAKIMQKSEAAVKALQQRALENLRRYLDL